MKNTLALVAASAVAACASPSQRNAVELRSTTSACVITTHVEAMQGGLSEHTLRSGGIAVKLREYAKQEEAPQARERMVRAFAQRLEQRGYRLAEDASRAAVSIEIDPSSYVHTNNFNARCVRLPEYEDELTKGESPVDPARAVEKAPDVLRVVVGAAGIAAGIVSPHFGSVMITQGSGLADRLNRATYGIFGAGDKAPVRVLLADRDRYQRGEQEFTAVVRVKAGEAKFSRTVSSTLPGDEPPFQVEALAAENWSRAIDSLEPARPSARAGGE